VLAIRVLTCFATGSTSLQEARDEAVAELKAKEAEVATKLLSALRADVDSGRVVRLQQ
jgi:hypothetical protein